MRLPWMFPSISTEAIPGEKKSTEFFESRVDNKVSDGGVVSLLLSRNAEQLRATLGPTLAELFPELPWFQGLVMSKGGPYTIFPEPPNHSLICALAVSKFH